MGRRSGRDERKLIMPNVNGKKYAYTPAGIAKAKAAAKKAKPKAKSKAKKK